MALRYRKRSRHRYMGTRRWGRGNIKHGRGAGSHGGRGFGGSSKHNWIWVITHYPDHFGKESMKSIKKDKVKGVNLWMLNQMALQGKFQKSGERFEADFTGCKILGTGKLEVPMLVKASAFSESAMEKIKGAGGEAKVAE